jgi:S-adenosyl-L-methionine hydrolase (adenosine-forming)
VGKPLPISFLSDYGYADDFVGVCHGVIAAIAPEAVVIDITHGLPRHEIRPAALVLRNTLPFMPAGVHLAVVDPGVGGARRPLALRCADGRLLVGPDNGLLWLAAERFGGVELAVDLGSSPFRLEPVSVTFHGRDVFAPVAARLALGTSPADVGERVPSEGLVRITLPAPAIGDGRIAAHAVYVDRFGNVQLNVDREQMAAAGFEPGDRLTIQAGGGRHEAAYARSFSDVPAAELLVYEDSYATIAIAVNRGSAADRLGIELDAPLDLLRG